MAAKYARFRALVFAALALFLSITPVSAAPWPTVVRMVGDFAASVASKFVANEISRHLHKDEYDELRRRLSTLESEVSAHRNGNVPPSEYREAVQNLQVARTKLDEIGQRLSRVEGRVGVLEGRVDSLERNSRPPITSPGGTTSPASGYFAFTICNRTPLNISVAVEYLSPELGGRVVQGWKAVAAGECSPGGRFRKGEFRFFARERSGPRQWSGDHPICVEPGVFKRLRSGPQNCPNNYLKYFNTKFVDSDSWTATITYRPG